MATCANCRSEISQGQEIVLRGKDENSPNVIMCSNCTTALEEALKSETQNPDLAGAFFLGFGAAVVSCLLWYAAVVITKYELGIVAIGVGWLIAQAVMLGAGEKRGIPLQLISVLITVIAMAFSEYLIVRHFVVVVAMAKVGYTDVPYLLPPDLIFSLIVEGIKSDPLTLVFWGIAVLEAFFIPAERKLQRATL